MMKGQSNDNIANNNRQHTHHPINLFLSLLPGLLTIVAVLFIFDPNVITAAAEQPQVDKSPNFQSSHSITMPITDTVHVKQFVIPTNPDTGSVVSICYAINGLAPRKLDVVLTFDVSSFMGDTMPNTTQTRLQASQAAANIFINSLSGLDRIAVVSYTREAIIVTPLTTTKNAITSTIYTIQVISPSQENMGEGIRTSHAALISTTDFMSDTSKTIILLSDGETSYPRNNPEAYAITKTLEAAEDHIKIYTIGIGDVTERQTLEDIAAAGNGKYFPADNSEVLASVYMTIASKLQQATITDTLIPGITVDCSQRSNWECMINSNGTTTLGFPIKNNLFLSSPAIDCFTATIDLDPGYEGHINLPNPEYCYEDENYQTICGVITDTATITVRGRKIQGFVYFDLNGNQEHDTGESGVPNVVVRATAMTGTALIPGMTLTTTTGLSGSYILHTSSSPTLFTSIDLPPSYSATSPTGVTITVSSQVFTASFGIRAACYLPIIMRYYPLPQIVNGSFEDGWNGWRHGGILSQTVISTHSYTGSYSALLGSPNYVCENGIPIGSAWIEQDLHVPDTYNPRLTFWYNIFSQDVNPYLDVEFDRFDFLINGEVWFKDARIAGTYGCTSPAQELGWRFQEIDLNSYKNQSITIRFENRNSPDRWFNTWTYVDNVRFLP